MRILAVDDDEIILELLSATLSATGYNDLTLANSAMQAATIIEDSDEPFDCFLLDIQMPEIDGIELCTAIRKTDGYEAAPILMITAMSQKSYIDRAFAAGATDYVTKPFEAIELGARIRMAERLVKSNRRAAENLSQVENLRSQIERDRFVDLSEPITISDIDGFISITALENYLLQLSRAGLFSTSIMALKIAGIETMFTTMSPTDFRFLLTDVADAIASSFLGTENFLTYAGHGLFICAVNGRTAPDMETIEISVNLAIEEMELTDSAGNPQHVIVRVGKSVKVGLLRAGRGAVEAMGIAAQNAENAVQNMPDQSRFRQPGWRSRSDAKPARMA